MNLHTSIGKPSNTDQWNQLCKLNGNLQQSTWYDAVQAYFRQYPVYLEVWQDGILLGGSKIYVFVPGTLRPLLKSFTKYFLQAGESVMAPDANPETVFPILKNGFEELLHKESPVWYNSYGYYNHPELLLYPGNLQPSETAAFANAWVPLDKSVDELWNRLHPHHQQKIHKAQKKAYSILTDENTHEFLKLLTKTYEMQGRTGPNPQFVKTFHTIMRPMGFSKIFIAVKEQEPVSGVLVTLFGQVASYSFGGSLRNNDGASQLLHWTMIKVLAENNFSSYYLGQVAIDEKTGDNKFREGITPFKRRFGTIEVKSSRKTFIFKPYSYYLWKKITLLTGKR